MSDKLQSLLQNSMKTLKSTNFQVRKGTLSRSIRVFAAAGTGSPSRPENSGLNLLVDYFCKTLFSLSDKLNKHVGHGESLELLHVNPI